MRIFPVHSFFFPAAVGLLAGCYNLTLTPYTPDGGGQDVGTSSGHAGSGGTVGAGMTSSGGVASTGGIGGAGGTSDGLGGSPEAGVPDVPGARSDAPIMGGTGGGGTTSSGGTTSTGGISGVGGTRGGLGGVGDAGMPDVPGSQAGAVTVTPTAVLPAHVDFGSVAQANTSAWKTFTITDPATGAATGKLTYSLDDTSNFQVFSLSNSRATSYPAGSCGAPTTTQLSPGANCTIQVAFTPTNATAPSITPRTANLTVEDATSGAILATIPIQGTATAQLTLSGTAISLVTNSVVTNQQTLAFGNVATGAQMPETFTINNNGATAASVASLTLAGTLPAGFAVTSTACNIGMVLPGGSSCQMTLVFTGEASTGPTSQTIVFTDGDTRCSGTPCVTASLVLTATTVQPAALALYGFGDLGSPTAPTGTIDLGSAPVSSNSGILTLWFTNTGGVAANGLQTSWAQTGTQFSLAENPGTCTTVGSLAPNATCSVNVQFIPAATGLQTAILMLFGQAIAPVIVKLQGTGI